MKHIFTALTSFSLLIQPILAASIVIESTKKPGRTYLDKARNGIDVVNIARPDKNGISHNRYIHFNVPAKGVILNNSPKETSTKLAGYIYGNKNVKEGPARLIINETTGPSRTLIEGFVEVAGPGADVIIANPNGITVTGGGFINIPRATLTTGQIRPGTAGVSFEITGGDIRIDKKGLNASKSDLDIFAESIYLNAAIHAKNVKIAVGDNLITPDGKIKKIGNGGVGIDSSSLGGIYAGAITLVGTANGVGVNLPGEILAQKDLTITADGDITLGTAISKGKAKIKSHKGSIAVKKGLYASNLHIAASDLADLEGAVGARYDVEIVASDLVSKSIIAAGVDQSFSDLGGGSLELDIKDSTKIGGVLKGGDLFRLATDSLKLGSDVTLWADTLDLTIFGTLTNKGTIASDTLTTIKAKKIDNKGTIFSKGKIKIKASELDSAKASIKAEGTLSLEVEENIDLKKGAIASKKDVEVKTSKLEAQESTIVAGEKASIQAKDEADLKKSYVEADDLALHTQTLEATNAQMLLSGDLRVKSSLMRADASKIKTKGDISLEVKKELSHKDGAVMYAQKGSISIETDRLIHKDDSVIQSAKATDVKAHTIDNTKATIVAKKVTLKAKTLKNSGGELLASDTASMKLDTLEGAKGKIVAKSGATIKAKKSVDISEAYLEAEKIKISTDKKDGRVKAKKSTIHSFADIAVSTNALQAPGSEIIAKKEISLKADDRIDISDGAVLEAGHDLTLETHTLDHSGGSKMSSGKKTEIRAHTVDNSSSSIIAGELAIKSTETLDNDDGTIYSQKSGHIETAVLSNVSGTIGLSEGRLSVISRILNNTLGTIASKDLSLQAHSVANRSGTIFADRSLSITTTSLDNTSGTLYAGNSASISTRTFTNTQGVVSSDSLDITARTLDNTKGVIDSATQAKLSLGLADNTLGTIASKDLSLQADSVANRDGTIFADRSITLTTTALDNTRGSIAAKRLEISAATLDNSAGTLYADETLRVQSERLHDTSGAILSGGALTLRAFIEALGNDDTIFADGSLDLEAGLLRLDRSLAGSKDKATIAAHTLQTRESTFSAKSLDMRLGSLQAERAHIEADSSLHISSDKDAAIRNGAVIANGPVTLRSRGDLDLKETALYSATSDMEVVGRSVDLAKGYLEAAGHATIDASDRLDLSKATLRGGDLQIAATGEILARSTDIDAKGSLTLTARDLTHTDGQIYAKKRMRIDLAGDLVQSSSSLITDGDLLLEAKNHALTDSSTLYAKRAPSIHIDDTLSILASSRYILRDDTDPVHLVLQRFVQKDSTLYAAGGLSLDADTIHVDDAVVSSDGDLALSARIFESPGYLYSDAPSVSIAADKTASIEGLVSVNGDLSLTSERIEIDKGGLESGGALEVRGTTLHVADARLLGTTATVIEAKEMGLGRGAKLLGVDGIDLFVGSSFTNRGEIVADALFGGKLRLDIDGSMTNYGTIGTPGTLLLKAASLTNRGKIQGSGDMQVRLAGGLSNGGFLTSAYDLTIRASSVYNTGGIAAANTLALFTHDLINRETLYSGGDMRLYLTGTLSNTGTIYAGTDLYIGRSDGGRARAIENRNGLIESWGDMTLSANTISNTGQGSVSYTQVWVNDLTGEVMTPEEIAQWIDERDDTAFWKKTHVKSVIRLLREWFETRGLMEIATKMNAGDPPGKNSATVTWREFHTETTGSASTDPAYIVSGGNIRVDAGTFTNKDAIISSGANLHFNVGTLQNIPTSTEVYEREIYHTISWWYKRKKLLRKAKAAIERNEYTEVVSGKTVIEGVSQILAGGAITGNVGSLQNGGSPISLGHITYSTATPLASQRHQEIAGADTGVERKDAERKSFEFADPSVTWSGDLPVDPGLVTIERPDLPDLTPVLGEGRLIVPSQIPVTILDITPHIHTPLFDGITLPRSPYGVFVTNPDPHGPLIELNPEYTNYNNYVSSDYLLEHLGYDPTEQIRRLGDAMYETQLVRNAIMNITGHRFIGGALDDVSMYIHLMDGGVKLAKEAGLVLGRPPTPEQLARADQDFVWLVLENVGGHTVLVPKVYLVGDYEAPKGGHIDARSIDLNVSGSFFNAGTFRAREDMRVRAAQITNLRGNIEAGRDLSLRSVGDIVNLSGHITGGRVSLVSQKGDILNETLRSRLRIDTDIGFFEKSTIDDIRATITATRDALRLEAAGSIANISASLFGAGSVSLDAGGDILFDAHAAGTSFRYDLPGRFTTYQKSTHQKSTVTTGGDFTLRAGGDASLVATEISAARAALEAKGSLYMGAREDLDIFENFRKTSGFLGDETTYRLDEERRVVATTLRARDVTLQSDTGIGMEAATVDADSIRVRTPSLAMRSLADTSIHRYDSTGTGLLTQSVTSRGTISQQAREAALRAPSVSLNGTPLGGPVTSQESSPHSAIATSGAQDLQKSWSQSHTSLNALGQLLVQAALIAVNPGAALTTGMATATATQAATQAAIAASINAAASQAAATAITGDTANLDPEAVAKSALGAGALGVGGAGIDQALGSSLLSVPAHSALQAGVSSALYGTDFTGVLVSELGYRATDALFFEAGSTAMHRELVRNEAAFAEGAVGKSLLHAAAGAAGAALTGGDPAAGAAAALVREATSPLTSHASLSHQQALSYLTGGLAGLMVDGAEGVDTGARVALSAEIYNRQLHHKEIEWLKDRENIEAFRKYYREYTGKEIGFDEAASLLAKGGVSLVDGGWNERFGSDPAVKEAMDFIKERYEGESLLWYAEPDGTLRSTKAFAPSLEEYGDRYGALVEFAKNKEFYETHLDLSTPSMGDPAGYMEGIASPVVTLFRSVQTDPWGTLESVGESVLHPIDSLYAAGMQLRTSYEKGRLDSLMGDDYAMSRHYGETLSGAVWALVGKATGSVVKAGSSYFTKLQDGSWVEVPRDAVVKGKDGRIFIKEQYTAPSGKTYNFYGQEINLDLIIPKINKATGKLYTNREWMKKGNNPYILDENGKPTPTNIHHSQQRANGPIFEIKASTHQNPNYQKVLHPYGKNKNPNDPVDHKEWNKDRIYINKERVKQLERLKKGDK